jgi:DNA modification methylase
MFADFLFFQIPVALRTGWLPPPLLRPGKAKDWPMDKPAVPADLWPATKIEMRPVTDLVPFVRNARTHPPEQVAQIASSMRRFGFTMPMLVAEDGTIIAGHGRLLAAQQLGLPEVPVMVAHGWSDEDRRLYTLADNRLAETSEWDPEMLRLEIEELRIEAGEDALAEIGFSSDEIAELLPGLLGDSGAGLTDPDDVPEPPVVPVSRAGDVWALGDHRLICGDSTKAETYEALLAGDGVDMVFTDPPYNVNYANTPKDKMRGKNRAIMNDNLGEGFYQFLLDAFTPMVRSSRGAIYIAMSSSELDTLQAAFRKAGGKWSTFIIWAKNTFTLGRADYQRQYEPILYGWKDGAKHYWCGARDQGDVWQIAKPRANDLHPTMKPVELVERAINNSSRPGETVMDPFGGSGTTLIAAERTGRQARLIELDPKYVDVIVRRWQEFTGREAVLEASGETFAETKAARRADGPSQDSVAA